MMINFKKLSSASIAVFAFTMSYAQPTSTISKQIKAGINLEAAFPTGDFGKSYSTGFGGSIMGSYALNENAKLTASLGYLSFNGKEITTKIVETDDAGEPINDDFGNPMYTTEKIKIPATHGIPLRLGANYTIGGPVFLQGEIGASFMKGGTAFLYAPGVGARFNNLELEAKYEGWAKNGTLSFFGIRVGYFF